MWEEGQALDTGWTVCAKGERDEQITSSCSVRLGEGASGG